VREAVAGDGLTSELMNAMLTVRAMLWKHTAVRRVWSSSSSRDTSSAGASWRIRA
jgi:hypothetical protein